jgi:nucleoside-diphosphate-sugar epimerase
MDILITGGSGVVGRRAIPLMLSLGHRVTAAGRSPARLDALRRMGATAIALDLFDPAAVRKAMDNHDTVVNLATHIPLGARAFLPGAWSETDRIRRDGSAILVDAAIAAGVKRFVQESFAPVFRIPATAGSTRTRRFVQRDTTERLQTPRHRREELHKRAVSASSSVLRCCMVLETRRRRTFCASSGVDGCRCLAGRRVTSRW